LGHIQIKREEFMKYMNQRTFDVFCLRTFIVKVTNESGTNYSDLVSEYMQMFDGDYLFLSQGSEFADLLISEWRDLGVEQQVALAQKAMSIRAELDDGMQKKSTLSKLFAGAAFTASHPDPQNRVKEAVENIRTIRAIL